MKRRVFEIKARSSLRESPLIRLGDEKEGRSEYNEHSENDEKEFRKMEQERVMAPSASVNFRFAAEGVRKIKPTSGEGLA